VNGQAVNTRVVLVSRPDGDPTPDNFGLESVPIVSPEAGHVLVAVDMLSIDAFIRTTLDDRDDSLHGSTLLGSTIGALGVGTVIESGDDRFQPGDAVAGGLGAQTHATVPTAFLEKVDTTRFRPATQLGAMGLTTGLTAYVGMKFVGRVTESDTVVVSGAAGAVGTFAGQIARLLGAKHVIGIAGGPEKGRYLVDELGYDASIDYRADDVDARLAELAPDGVDVFFDNVGGDILDSVLLKIHEGSRIVICGAISQYADMNNVTGPRNYLKLAERHASMEGFTVLHFASRFAEARADIGGWLTDGSLVEHNHVERGIEQFPHALDLLLTGGHRGKLLVDVSGNT
jgi:NADPH-dependent curcumin reductase CurA